GRRQTCIRPIAGEKEIAPRRHGVRPFGILGWRGRERRAALAHDLPWRNVLWKAGNGCDLVPNLVGQSFTRNVEQAVGATDGHRQSLLEGEQPFDGAVYDSNKRRQPARRLDAEMCIDNGTELVRGLQIWDEVGRYRGRCREDDAIALLNRHAIVSS